MSEMGGKRTLSVLGSLKVAIGNGAGLAQKEQAVETALAAHMSLMSVGKHRFIVMASALALASCAPSADTGSEPGGADGSDNAATRVSSVQPMATPDPNVLFFKCEGSGSEKVSGSNLNEPITPVNDELNFLRIDLGKKAFQFGSTAQWFNLCGADDRCKAEFTNDTIDYAVSGVDREDGEETKFAARWVISRGDGSYRHEDGSETRENGQLKIARKITTKGVCSVVPEQSATG